MKKLASAALAFIFVTMFALNAEAAPKEIKFAYDLGVNSPQDIAAKVAFSNFIHEKSGGRFKVTCFPQGTVGGPDTVYQSVLMGDIQIYVSSPGNFTPFVPEVAVLDLPYLFHSAEDATTFLQTKSYQLFLDNFARKARGITPAGLMIPEYPFRIFASGKPIKKLDDLKGLKARSTASKIHVAFLNAVGANATPISGAEVPSALQQGVVDCADGELVSAYCVRWFDMVNNIYAPDAIVNPNMTIMSEMWFKSLSEEDQAMIREGIDLYHNTVRKLVAEESVKIREELAARGVNYVAITDSDKDRAIEMTKKVWNDLPEETKKLAEAIKNDMYGN